MQTRRRLARAFLIAAATMVVAVATSPWWMPPAIVFVAGRSGVRVGDWEKDGWLRAVYRDVDIGFDGGTASVREVRVPVFGIWPRREGDAPTILARDVRVSLQPSGQPRPPQAEPPSVHQIVSGIDETWPKVRRWLPPAEVEQVWLDAGATQAGLASVRWDGETLHIDGTIPRLEEAVTLTVTRREDEAFVLDASLPGREARIAVTVVRTDDGVKANAAGSWKGNPLTASAQFGPVGFIPLAASVDAPTVGLDAATVGLSGYGPIDGGVSLTWDGEVFGGEARAAATPAKSDGALPPLDVDVRIEGTIQHARFETARVSIPGMHMKLSAPLEWRFAEGIPTSAAQFDVSVDLAKLPWIEATGTIAGTAEVARGTGDLPRVDFELQGDRIGWHDVTLSSFDLAGSWAAPLLEIERFDASIDDASSLQAEGSVDLAARSIVAAKLHAAAGAASIRAWLPKAPEFSSVTADIEASGDFSAVSHKSSLSIRGLQGAPGGAVNADVSSTGTGIEQLEIEGTVRAESGVAIPFASSVARDAGGTIQVNLERLAWDDAGGRWWSLEQPAHIRIEDADTAGGSPRIVVDELWLVGESLAASLVGNVRWPAEGNLKISTSRLTGERLKDLVPEAYRQVEIESLELDAQWNDGPLAIDGRTRLKYVPEVDTEYAVEAAFRSDRDTDSIEADLDILADSGVVLSGTGRLPLTLSGTRDGISLRLPHDGPVSVELASTPNPEFWSSVSELTGWTVSDPSLQASLTGALGEPRGAIVFSARELTLPRQGNGSAKLPHLSDLALRLTADDDGVALDKAVVAVEGRWIQLAGRAPWRTWRQLKDERRFAWRETEFLLATNPMPVAIASRAFPTVLAPDGDVSIDVRHNPGEGLSGHVWLHGASLRPIAPVGAIRDINAELNLADYDVEIPVLTAHVGGRPIEISGRGRVHPGDRIDFDLHATSTRVPIVRDAGLIVRAGLDLRVVRDSTAPARISGRVDLGPSVYVSDLVSLIPSGSVAAPEQRPPFFSVQEKPFANWTLDVDVTGNDFLRVENPFFVGTLSADFKLEGTLGEPRAIGKVTATTGAVIFPFARVPLEDLEVSLSRESPYDPQILMSGFTRVFGYDVRMEASGTAAEPRLLFNSDPPLSSQAVFLMLSTGALPDESHGFTTSERARRLAFFLGKNLAAGLGLGGGSGDDRLTVRSGENFSREGRETVYVQYDLNGRWSVVGEYDRFDAYNGGIKFRLIDR